MPITMPPNEIRSGTEGDYYTSADLDPIFGQLLARQFQQMAKEFDSFTLIELGAGKGLLARDILSHTPFSLHDPRAESGHAPRQEKQLAGFNVRWIDELPKGITGCIFSNEFFDALPVHRIVRRGGVLREIYVTENFEEVEGDLQESVDAALAGRPDRRYQSRSAQMDPQNCGLSRPWIPSSDRLRLSQPSNFTLSLTVR